MTTCCIIKCNANGVLTLDLMGIKFNYCKKHKFFGDKMLHIKKRNYRPCDIHVQFNKDCMEKVKG